MELDYKANSSQNIFDVSNIVLFGMDNIVMGLLSPSNKSLISSLTLETLIYNDAYAQDNTIQLQLNVPKINPDYVVKGKDGQSTFDLCIMNYGNLDKLVSMIQENTNLVSINDIDVSLKEINFNANKSNQDYTVSAIAKKGYVFGTLQKAEVGFVWDGEFVIWDGTDRLIY